MVLSGDWVGGLSKKHLFSDHCCFTILWNRTFGVSSSANVSINTGSFRSSWNVCKISHLRKTKLFYLIWHAQSESWAIKRDCSQSSAEMMSSGGWEHKDSGGRSGWIMSGNFFQKFYFFQRNDGFRVWQYKKSGRLCFGKPGIKVKKWKQKSCQNRASLRSTYDGRDWLAWDVLILEKLDGGWFAFFRGMKIQKIVVKNHLISVYDTMENAVGVEYMILLENQLHNKVFHREKKRR